MFIVQATVPQTSIGYLDFVASFLGWSGSQSREHWNLPLDESFRSNIRVPLRPLKVKSGFLLLVYLASSHGAVVWQVTYDPRMEGSNHRHERIH
jgi:hypothetical protein